MCTDTPEDYTCLGNQMISLSDLSLNSDPSIDLGSAQLRHPQKAGISTVLNSVITGDIVAHRCDSNTVALAVLDSLGQSSTSSSSWAKHARTTPVPLASVP
jgi:hypothetical protein